ncbi:acyl-CoA thioesterase [Leptospira yasudae]|uniref:Acyl-CoA thioesterase n=1 Tax=Leptospira yasudae TaxID=2202201 RepID=A0A6N4QLB2_9LEPT|nr:acyl-CoA thioesterase [Leptospira yasudae]MBW0434442.1 acyl-CoA thioesterase [Leptospira yasudae]TGL76160.1 acyl-CoA thioesterase [Leptospira yasudae]TGL79311.1 acyl-CoA thioesterase [Leptospira yasudae]TGL82998.1 acyl-CoA thioesterase [Leptospira yasudae]
MIQSHTKTHQFETSFAKQQCDANGSLNIENAQKLLNEARKEALKQAGFDSSQTSAAHIEPLVLWSESDYRGTIQFPDSILIQTEFRMITNARYRILQRLIRKSDRKVVCNSNSFCILFDSDRKRPWKQSVSLRAV